MPQQLPHQPRAYLAHPHEGKSLPVDTTPVAPSTQSTRTLCPGARKIARAVRRHPPSAPHRRSRECTDSISAPNPPQLCILSRCMTCLQAFLAGFVLGLDLARVSPSGKARASQARMRGFESRHPLQDNLKPAFERTTPHGWLFVRRRAFLIHELKNFRRLCKIYLATAIYSLQKQKSQYFCNFFSIRDSLSSLQSKKRARVQVVTCGFAPRITAQ